MLDVNESVIRSPAEDPSAMAFEEVWNLLPRLENEVVTTAAHRKRYNYQIGKVSDKGVLRRSLEPAAEEPQAGTRERLVGKTHFRRCWERLASVGVCGMDGPHNRFVAGCFIKLPELGVWYANSGRGWGHRTFLVLGNPASKNGRSLPRHQKPSDWVYDRIVSDPRICSGKPTIRGTRIMVGGIIGMYWGGYTTDKILQGFHWISREDVEAALEFSRVDTQDERLIAGN